MPKKVLIVGSGAAGSACAWSLSRFPERFSVEVWDKQPTAGGVATSENIEGKGNLYINDGVQGGAPSYRNTLSLFNLLGFEVSPVDMKISFGFRETAWTNYSESPVINRLQLEIARFGKVLKWINKLEAVFIFIPISLVLRVLRFSNDFCNLLLYPLTALFFGTGNQTPSVSAAIIARVFLDPEMRLFDYDPKLFLSQTPRMFAFPKLESIYKSLIAQCPNVKWCFQRPVKKIIRHSDGAVTALDEQGLSQRFDDVVFACDAETVLKVLEKPSFLEQRILGNVKYFNDITITHEDEEYMREHYEVHQEADQYLVRFSPDNPKKIEMSFNLTCYQPQLRKQARNIYQTIFLDDRDRKEWSIAKIDESKILLTKWWRQFAHTWRHFAFTVPFLRFIQGKQNTLFCGAYCLVNTHESAVISGLAAAHRLGATYPFAHDALATKQFDQYLRFIHGKSRSEREEKKGAGLMDRLFYYVLVVVVVVGVVAVMF